MCPGRYPSLGQTSCRLEECNLKGSEYLEPLSTMQAMPESRVHSNIAHFQCFLPQVRESCHHTIPTPIRYPIASLTMPACFSWPFPRTWWQYQQVQWEYILSSSPFPDLGVAPLTGIVAAVLVSFCTGDQTVRNILSISLSMVPIYSFLLFSLSKESLFSGSHRLCHSGQTWTQGRLCSPYASHASILGFPGGSDGKESACNSGDLGSIRGLGRSAGGRHDNPLQDSCLENPHGQRSLTGYSLWGHKESDMTEHLNTAQPCKMASCLRHNILLSHLVCQPRSLQSNGQSYIPL